MPSREYVCHLKSPRWQVIRAAAILRSGGICRDCERRDVHLQVHHLTYVDLGVEQPGQLVALCDACHAKRHNRQPGQLALFSVFQACEEEQAA